MTDESEQEHVELELTVRKSKIGAIGGIARINKDMLPHIKIEKGDEVEIYTKEPGKAIIVQLTADALMEKNLISMRGEDMKKLEVEEGAKVYLKAHHTIMDTLQEWKDKIVAKFKGKEGEENE
jgi:formylmethanofuran dehydrogenase subunit D